LGARATEWHRSIATRPAAHPRKPHNRTKSYENILRDSRVGFFRAPEVGQSPHRHGRKAMESIRFDDVEKLRSKVSQDFSAWSKPIEVTQDKINQFADVTGDHQWIHIDIERAKRESPFKGPVAHGFLTLSLIPAFEIPREWNVTSFRNVVNYGANKLRFISPVPAGAKVHARSRVVAVEPKPQGTQVTTETQVQVVGQDKPALIYEGIFLYVK
jgi:acyl dehydratase